MHQITETIRLSTQGRGNMVKLRDGLPIHTAALRELVKKGVATKDGKLVPSVLAEFNARHNPV